MNALCQILAIVLFLWPTRVSSEPKNGEDFVIPAIQVSGSLGGENSGAWEISAAVSDASHESGFIKAVAGGIASDLKDSPDLPITIVVVGEGEPRIDPVNEKAKAEDLSSAETLGVQVAAVEKPPAANLAHRVANRFKNARLFYANSIRPNLPISPKTPQDSSRESLRMMKLKGFLGGSATGLVVFLFRESPDHSSEGILKGLTLLSFQAALAMATAYRNNEVFDWLADQGLLSSTGVKDKSKWASIKRDTKFFGITATLIALANAEAGLLGLKPTIFDSAPIAAGGILSTVIVKGWYSTMIEHLSKTSPWMVRIPVFVYAVGTLGNVAAAVDGPMNLVSLAAWGGLGASGFASYYALKNKESLTAFAKSLQGVARKTAGVANHFCQIALGKVRRN